MKYNLPSLISILLFVLSAHSSEDFAQVHQLELQNTGNDFMVPSKIWDEITGMSFEKAFSKSLAIVYVPTKVILTEKNKGILKYPRIEIMTARGGSDLDLSEYTTGQQGTFFVQFEFEGMSNSETFRSYFISKSRKRKLEDGVVGSGCKAYFDLRSHMLGENKKIGLAVNTTRQRHVSVLSGHFLFSSSSGKQIYVSSVTFKDSSYPQLICDKQRDSSD